MMIKKRIAIIFGGNSTEYEVSLQSASAVLRISTLKSLTLFLLELAEMVNGIITRVKSKELQITLGLKIPTNSVLLSYLKVLRQKVC